MHSSIMIKNGIVVTMDASDRVLQPGSVYIEGNSIRDVGNADSLEQKYRAEVEVDARRKLVVPGLINCHNHFLTLLRRGLKHDLPFSTYLREVKWPFESSITEEDAYVGALQGCLEAIKSGTTFSIENYYPPRNRKLNVDSIAKAVEKSGLRVVIARGYHNKDVPEYFYEDEGELLAEYARLLKTWHMKANGKVGIWVGLDNLLYSTRESIVTLYEFCMNNGIGIHSHVAEDPNMMRALKHQYGKGFIELLNELNVLGPRFHAAHTIYVSDEEIETIAKTGTKVVHNPASNMSYAEGTAPILKMLQSKVNLGLGTDTRYGMVEAMKYAVNVHRVWPSPNPQALSVGQALRMATIEGAKVLGLANEVGSLEVGKKADITIVDIWKPHIAPIHSPVESLYFCADSDVDTVIVDGRILMEKREVKTIDERDILERSQACAYRLASALRRS